jgi:hypothetical protein
MERSHPFHTRPFGDAHNTGLRILQVPDLFSDGIFYEENRYDRFEPRKEERERKRAIKALERLGYHVIVERVA